MPGEGPRKEAGQVGFLGITEEGGASRTEIATAAAVAAAATTGGKHTSQYQFQQIEKSWPTLRQPLSNTSVWGPRLGVIPQMVCHVNA